MLADPFQLRYRMVSLFLALLLRMKRARGLVCRNCGAPVGDPVGFVTAGCECGARKLRLAR